MEVVWKFTLNLSTTCDTIQTLFGLSPPSRLIWYLFCLPPDWNWHKVIYSELFRRKRRSNTSRNSWVACLRKVTGSQNSMWSFRISQHIYHMTLLPLRNQTSSNLQSSLLRCGTRPNEWGTNETRTHSCRFASLAC